LKGIRQDEIDSNQDEDYQGNEDHRDKETLQGWARVSNGQDERNERWRENRQGNDGGCGMGEAWRLLKGK
jgi:hypothetical protein